MAGEAPSVGAPLRSLRGRRRTLGGSSATQPRWQAVLPWREIRHVAPFVGPGCVQLPRRSQAVGILPLGIGRGSGGQGSAVASGLDAQSKNHEIPEFQHQTIRFGGLRFRARTAPLRAGAGRAGPSNAWGLSRDVVGGGSCGGPEYSAPRIPASSYLASEMDPLRDRGVGRFGLPRTSLTLETPRGMLRVLGWS